MALLLLIVYICPILFPAASAMCVCDIMLQKRVRSWSKISKERPRDESRRSQALQGLVMSEAEPVGKLSFDNAMQ